jgi:hydrogenase nickel insertion protein HypA
MHESTLAKRLLEAAIAIGRQRHARRVVSLHAWIADAEPLDHASVEAHFSLNANGTIAEGARLCLQLSHVAARCVDCDATYLPIGHLTLCPRCGSSEAKLTGRTGAGIESLEVED